MEGFCQLYLPKLNGRKVLGREKQNMYRKDSEGWLKHGDFIVLDMICLQLAFILAYAFRGYGFNVYGDILYRNMAIFLGFADLVVIFTSGTMKSVLKRGHYKEFVTTLKNAVAVGALAIAYLFIIQEGQSFSRMILITTIVIYLILTYAIREIWKNSLHKKMENGGDKKLLIITSKAVAENVVHSMQENNYARYSLAGVVVIDEDCTGEKICGVPVVAGESDVPMYVCQEWIDEVLIVISENLPYPDGLIDKLTETGVTVHLNLAKITNQTGKRQFVEKVGSYTVLTTSLNYASFGQLFLKRLMDICGGLVGCIFTGIITIFVGPAIYLASPGPIFFSQERVGKNGKKFKMYKFRSMYMDAEARKAELMKENKLGDGKMFKMDFDPRVIGNKVLPDGSHKTGVGDFIRRTSLDEFPQFFNVLKGDMSIVGTRPPLISETNLYEPRHKARLAIKPGITGMWQVSGRSDITDFEEVVRLDKEYIENWDIGLDIKILLKTVMVLSTCLICLYQPFMKLWTGDGNLFEFNTVILLVVYFYINMSRRIVVTFKDATGMWEADKFKPLISGIVNACLNIILIQKIGINGVVISTVIAFTFIEYPWETKVLFDDYFQEKEREFYVNQFKDSLIILIVAIITFRATYMIPLNNVIGFISRGICCVCISAILFCIIWKKRLDILKTYL